jgi:hypothetical protein
MAETPKLGDVDFDGRGAFEDAKAFNKGKGRLLVAMIGSLLLALAAFAWYLVQDQPNPYGELGKQVNGLRGQYFDGFWNCALPGKQLGAIKNDGDLRAELHQRATSGQRYAQYLSDKCRPQTRELITRLRALLPPEEARPLVQQMIEALTKMDSGTRVFVDYLQNLEGAYEPEQAESALSDLVRGWYEFRKAHGALNQLVRTKLGR